MALEQQLVASLQRGCWLVGIIVEHAPEIIGIG
jgi:hypothetical protein